MNYDLSSISESFMNKIQKVKTQKQDDPLKMDRLRQNTKEEFSVIRFSCPKLGKFLQDRLNQGRPFSIYEAKSIEFPLGGQIFIDFEKKYRIKSEYSFNELRYFSKAKIVPMDGDNESQSSTYLSEVTVPDAWDEIPAHAFSEGYLGSNKSGLDHVKKINYSERISYFRNFCFNGSKATNIYIPKTATKFGKGSFESIKFNRPTVIIPEGIAEIPDYCFESIDDVKEFIIPNSVNSIKTCAFQYSKIEKMTIPDSVESIGTDAFSACKNLKYIKLPKNITKIPWECFEYDNFQNIVIPKGVTFIDVNAFSGNNNLSFIDIPASVTKIAKKAINNCPNIIKVKLHSYIKDFHLDNFSQNDDWAEEVPAAEQYYSNIFTLYLPDDIYFPDDYFLIKIAKKVIYYKDN